MTSPSERPCRSAACRSLARTGASAMPVLRALDQLRRLEHGIAMRDHLVRTVGQLPPGIGEAAMFGVLSIEQRVQRGAVDAEPQPAVPRSRVSGAKPPRTERDCSQRRLASVLKLAPEIVLSTARRTRAAT